MPRGTSFRSTIKAQICTFFPWSQAHTINIRRSECAACEWSHQFLLTGLWEIRVFHSIQTLKHGRISTRMKYKTKLGQDKSFAVRFLTLRSWISWRESFFALPSYVPYPWLSKENMTIKYLTHCLSIILSIWLSLGLQKQSGNRVERESFHPPSIAAWMLNKRLP